MAGDLIYPEDAPNGHRCDPPIPSYAPTGSVWVCACGEARIKTSWTYIPEAWRAVRWWDFESRRLRRHALVKRRVKQAEDQFAEAQKVVDSYVPDKEGLV